MSLRSALVSVLLVLSSFLAGCSQTAVLNQIASPGEQAFARKLVAQLQARDIVALERAFDRELATPAMRRTLETMAGMMPAGAARSVKIVDARKLYGRNVTTLISTYEYEFDQGWLLARVVVREKDGARGVTAFHVQRRSQSLEDEFRFSLAGKGFSHYLFLVLVFAAVALSLAALVVCVRMRPLRRKWLWILFIVIGFCQFTINWSTGVVSFAPLHLQLLSAMAIQPPTAPWMISFAIPLGAIVFLAYAMKREEQAAASTEARPAG